MRWIGTLTLLTAATLLSSAVYAAQGTASREAFYRCRDKKGQTHYGDSMPPQCAGVDTEVLNERGMTLRLIEGEQTRAARLEREKAEARTQRLRDEALLRDRTLIDTYLTVEDIERLRDQRLEMLVAQYRVTEQNITNLLDRQSRLETQIARFKPYASHAGAPPLPDHLAEEMVNMVNGLKVYRESLAKNRQEQVDLTTSFDADIKRFKELKGLK
jgi:Domain of unknown function (DUF4124)